MDQNLLILINFGKTKAGFLKYWSDFDGNGIFGNGITQGLRR